MFSLPNAAVCTLPSLWECFPASRRWFHAAVSESSEIVKSQFCKTVCRTLSIGSGITREGLRRAQWFSLQQIPSTSVWPYWNLAVGRRQYQCSHFLLALCNNYCHHKTETALHYSQILLHMHIPTRLVIPSLGATWSFFLDKPDMSFVLKYRVIEKDCSNFKTSYVPL